MAMYFFLPDGTHEVHEGSTNKAFPHLTYVYVGSKDEWHVFDPKGNQWIRYDAEGVPEVFRMQLLLLTAAHQ